MASKVPKFGAWEGGENFTVYFDNARKVKTNGQKINPNDPEENPDMFPQNGGPVQPQPTPSQSRTADKQGKQTKVPQFGAWDKGDNVGYTVCFDNARKSKTTGPTVLETEPQLNREIHPRTSPPAQAQAQAQVRPASNKPKVPQFGDWESERAASYTVQFDHLKKKKHDPKLKEESSDSAQFNQDVAPPAQEGRARVPQFGAWNGGENAQYTAYFESARKTKTGGPSEPQLNRDVGDRARPTPATKARAEPREDGLKNSSRESNYSVQSSESSQQPRRQTPVVQPPPQLKPKLQARPVAARGNPAVGIPQFGGWNNDPQQADGYTTAFARAKEEKNTPIHASVPPSYHKQPHYKNQQQPTGACCCIL